MEVELVVLCLISFEFFFEFFGDVYVVVDVLVLFLVYICLENLKVYYYGVFRWFDWLLVVLILCFYCLWIVVMDI